MNTQHPEDIIYKTKTFINELQKVQETYFTDLVSTLNLNNTGEQWLFDYVYNTSEEDRYDDFEHFLEDYKHTYKEMTHESDMLYNPSVTLLSTPTDIFSPLSHMSSHEPELETSFPSFYDDKEQIGFELDTLYATNSSISVD